MKIAVYTIAKNEKAFIERWAKSAAGADYMLIVDGGSNDGSKSEVERVVDVYDYPILWANINITPFRFDDARNASLALLPADIDVCICLDMDEILLEGWREIIEQAWQEDTTRLRYNYVWSWNEDKTPALTYHAEKIHTRQGYRWKNPVHEILVRDGRCSPEKQVFINDTLIEHHPDHTKSRSFYLSLMALAVKENPNDDRMAHYYARELMFYQHYPQAIQEFKRHLSMPEAIWDSEKSASYRYLGDCYWALGDLEKSFEAFDNATKLAPNEREPWVSYAQAFRAKKAWRHCKDCCDKALAITERPNSYINQPVAWSDWPKRMRDEAISNLTSCSI